MIVSMKYGLHQFVFRDIDALIKKGNPVQLFTLLNRKGLYNPLPSWNVVPVMLFQVVIAQFVLLFQKPLLYLRLLGTALRTNSLRDFCIATYFSNHMQETDIIFSYFGDHKFFVGYYCKRITGKPLIVSIRAYELHKNPNPRLFKIALEYCDRVVTITEYNRDILIKNFGVAADKIDIVRQILNLDLFCHTEKIKILIVGFFAKKKGHEILLEAVKRLNRPDVEVWVVGDHVPDREHIDVREWAESIGISSQVAFFGEQSGPALRALYRECDIFCLPSRVSPTGDMEGFPNVIAEAMGFKKPVVSTRHAGIPEVVDSILVDENSVEQLSDALATLCDSTELRRKMGERNRIIVEEMFSPANNDRLAEILRRYANKLPSESTDVVNREQQTFSQIHG